MPSENVHEKEIKDRVQYSKWIKAGYITSTTGDVVDIDFIFKYICDMAKKYKIKSICCDPWNATALMTKLDAEGFDVIEIRQGYKTLSEPTKLIKELILKSKLIHFNNPVLKWCTANAIPKFDSNENVVLDKSQSTHRIDAIASTINAMTRAMLHGTNDKLNNHLKKDDFTF